MKENRLYRLWMAALVALLLLGLGLLIAGMVIGKPDRTVLHACAPLLSLPG